jgi:hypothetical protein
LLEGCFVRRVARHLSVAALAWAAGADTFDAGRVVKCVAAAGFAAQGGTQARGFARVDAAWFVV